MTEASRIPTAVVTPEQSIEIPFQVDDVCGSPGERHLAAYSLTHASVLLLSEYRRTVLQLAEPPGDLCLSVDLAGKLLAYCCSDKLLRVRNLLSEKEVIIQDCPEVLAARFDEQGRLWTVREGAELLVEVRAAGEWRVIGRGEVTQLGAGADVRPGPSQDAMFVSPYSGQSEQENWHCDFKNGDLRTRLIEAMDGDQFVFAAPRIATVVALDHRQCEIACFTDPFDASLARIPWPDFVEEDCEDERPGYYGCFVDRELLLACSSEGRLFLFELAPLRVKKEVHVAGHEPVPLVVKYPTLQDTSGLVSDLVCFGRYGNNVAAFFAPHHRGPRPRLVTLRLADILA